jgi:hypothetical protein
MLGTPGHDPNLFKDLQERLARALTVPKEHLGWEPSFRRNVCLPFPSDSAMRAAIEESVRDLPGVRDAWVSSMDVIDGRLNLGISVSQSVPMTGPLMVRF